MSQQYRTVPGVVYIGVGNGSPWYARLRSPDGGDNLYLSSILALRASDGQYVWHYQTTPGDNRDYTATQPLMLGRHIAPWGDERNRNRSKVDWRFSIADTRINLKRLYSS